MIRKPLAYFDQAARHGSIRKAAEALNVASSAVNRQLLLLEDEMGVELFERHSRGIRPTAAGELLLSYIRRWGREERMLLHEIGGLRRGVRGTIRIAAADSICETILPGALAQLQARYPQIDFRISSGDSEGLISALFQGDADMAIAYDLIEHERADVIQIIPSPIGLIVPRDHPLSERKSVSFSDYAPYPFVLPNERWLRHSSLRQLLDGRYAPPSVAARAERPSILKALVEAGVGIGFLTRLGADHRNPNSRINWVPLVSGIVEPALIARGIAAVVVIFALILLTGWRYDGPKRLPATLGVGALSGVLMASTSLGNPPVMVYLLSSRDPAAVNRANFTGYFAVTLLALIAWMLLQGLISWEAVLRAAALLLPFLGAVWVGSRLFRKSSERLYRRVALGLLLCIGLYGLLR